MNKTRLAPPENWPPEAQALYWDFEAKLRHRIVHYRDPLRALSRLFQEQARLGLLWRELPPRLFDEYLALATRKTVHRFLGAARAWLRFLYGRKVLFLPLHEDLPAPRRVPQQRRRLLSHDQVVRFLGLLPLEQPVGMRDRAFFEMAYGTAMRLGELLALNLSDLDLTLGTVRVRRAKNTYERMVPLTSWALWSLRRYLLEARPQLSCPHSAEALWLANRRGSRLGKGTLSKLVLLRYQPQQQLGFHVTAHMIRHAAATHLLSAGAGLREVQELLGHRHVNSTAIYTHITPTHLVEVHRRCHPRNNGAFTQEGMSWQGKSFS